MDINIFYDPLPKQLIAHMAKEKHLLYGGAVGGGKSVFLVNDALRQCLGWAKNKVGIFRWEYSVFKKTTFDTMQEWILDVSGLVQRHNQQDHIITLCNGSEIVYGGMKPSSSVAGDPFAVIKSLELASVYIDELSDVPEKIYLFLCTRVGRIRARNVLTNKIEYPPPRVAATCNPHLGWIKSRWVDKVLPDHRFIPSSVKDNTKLPPDYEQRLRTIWKDSPEWIEQYLEGDWGAVVDYESIFRADLLLKSTNRSIPPTEPVEFGVDVGAFGDDMSVIGMRQGYHGSILWTKKKQSTMDLVNQIVMLSEIHNPINIKVDSIGVGQGVYDRLAELGYPVEPIIGGAKPIDDRFINKRAEMFWELRTLLEKGIIQLPDHSELINEMGSIKYMVSGSGRTIQVESKKDIKKRLGHSPDYADAMVYTFAGSGWEYVTSSLVRV